MQIVVRINPALKDPRVHAAIAMAYLKGVVLNNRLLIRSRQVPPLYSSGVEWRPEAWAGQFEEFADAATVMQRGFGDCDDLCAWRVAELHEQGETKARFRIYGRRGPRGWSMHVQVRRANGEIEDPSRFLGMGPS